MEQVQDNENLEAACVLAGIRGEQIIREVSTTERKFLLTRYRRKAKRVLGGMGIDLHEVEVHIWEFDAGRMAAPLVAGANTHERIDIFISGRPAFISSSTEAVYYHEQSHNYLSDQFNRDEGLHDMFAMLCLDSRCVYGVQDPANVAFTISLCEKLAEDHQSDSRSIFLKLYSILARSDDLQQTISQISNSLDIDVNIAASLVKYYSLPTIYSESLRLMNIKESEKRNLAELLAERLGFSDRLNRSLIEIDENNAIGMDGEKARLVENTIKARIRNSLLNFLMDLLERKIVAVTGGI